MSDPERATAPSDSVKRPVQPRRTFERLTKPRSIAVLGASSDPLKAGGRPIHYLNALGYSGQVYPVNPVRQTVQGYQCYPTLEEVPGDIDLCVIAVPQDQVEGALVACGQRGVGVALVFASGYAETGEAGFHRQRRLREIARSHRMPLIGPNCLGYINVRGRVGATFTTALDRGRDLLPGPLALISQSGAVGAFLIGMAEDERVGLSHLLTTGNEADVTAIEFAEYLLEDPEVAVFGLYLEGVDGREFVSFATQAAAAGKPVVVMKVGSSARGAAASASHTGKMAGSDDVYEAVFEQLAITRARSITELFDFSRALGQPRRSNGNCSVGIVSISGGIAVLVADWCERVGLELARFSEVTETAIGEALPWFGGVSNPVDTTGRPLWDEGMLQAVLQAVATDAEVGIVLCHIGLAPDSSERVAAEIAEVALQTTKPIFVCWIEEQTPNAHERLRSANVPIFSDPVQMVRAAKALVSYEQRRAATNARARRVVVAGHAARWPTPVLPPAGAVVTEFETKKWLQQIGIPVPSGGLVETEREAVELAERLGYPVCVKLIDDRVLHRSDIGAVMLDLKDKREVHEAVRTIRRIVEERGGSTHETRFLVERQAADGVELMVSTFRDSVFGPCVLVAPGGVYAELFEQKVVRLAPVDQREAGEMLRGLRVWPILAGARGRDGADVAAASRAIAALSNALAMAPADVQTVEVNPLRILEKGAGIYALDGLILREV